MLASSSKHVSRTLKISRPLAVAYQSTVAGTSQQDNFRPASWRPRSTQNYVSRGGPQQRSSDRPRFADNGPPTTASLNLALIDGSRLESPHTAVQTLIKFKDNELKPDLLTFHAAAGALASRALYREVWALVDDMQGVGLKPDIVMFNYLLRASSSILPSESMRIFDIMKNKYHVTPNRETYEYLISRHIASPSVETVLRLLFEMDKEGITPLQAATQSMLEFFMSHGLVNIALDVARNYEANGSRRLDAIIWTKLLMAASDNFFADGVSFLWNKVVKELMIKPTEGLCLEVANVAGRFGLGELAVDVLRQLKSLDVSLEEYHFAPMISAFASEKRFKDAFAVLCMLQMHNIKATSSISQPIFAQLQADPKHMEAAWSALEELYNEGTALSILGVNVIIQAAVAHGDLQRAVGTYQVLPELQLKADTDTFNYLFSGAITAKHRELGDQLMRDMKEANVRPNAQTYERLIVLCLSAGDSYEDAFFYLEEMKAQSHIPPLSVYEAIIRRCVLARDERYQVAVDELKEHGYEQSQALTGFLEKYGPQSDGSS